MTPLGGGAALEAPAKLNRWLAVVGRRPDGFHELDSELVLLELADRLTVASGRGLRVSGGGAGMPRGRTNLAWRGLALGLGVSRPPHRLHLDKLIPVSAGLGGGSSDGAAAWRLGRWLATGVDAAADVADLGRLADLGADIPFFAARLSAGRIRGRGETVEPAVGLSADTHVVLVQPPFGLSTAAVFAELRPADWRASGGAGAGLEPGRNDLLAPAMRLRPEIGEVFRLVLAAGAQPYLSGSGPTVFVLTDDPERAGRMAQRLGRGGLRTSRTRIRGEPASILPQ